ncbi:hypothetical protein A3C32_00490 [Candidatus Daviesbacteria bacterium RIFCSPHIGHO2_02_FULL_41_14]|uniref:Uncharacterized protein n=1 Tax=Candidatus Daviesbacteria bacterium RIFCSPLOWO2_01_FULL_40_24 TaxID=1797787 RepID=A0A1F5MIH1_9BACT|nr:MAG: hypothetical protein A2780_03405 [Candidatus Daviesbacteria bacterium RIFCSPHIGHO2_01_FULL_41_45]OGE34192.1 MAG: hypothetical protein A3C32_00490 [Candidatus Daviesbacteria bacterium RIFCSPHIGHO2_02_FULL_41_14]OGE65176.1 MAG: hypothetical protein A3B49_01440 [Candidatus Daviesbacteria bacterium RIFCSPLOWO2_01_FULL_40_24]
MVKLFRLVFNLKKRYLLLITVIILIGGGFLFLKLSASKEPLQFAEVKRVDIKSIISISGSLQSKSSINLKFGSSGKLSYLHVAVGDIVKTGQLIAGLDTQELNIALQQTQNTLKDKQAIVDKVYDDLKNHEKDETYLQKQTRTTAEVARDNAYDGVKAAQAAYKNSVITAPFDGIITEVSVVAGQRVSTTETIAVVSDKSESFFDAEVDETDIPKIKITQLTEIVLDSFPDKIFSGKVSEIMGQTQLTSSNATVVKVRIKLDASSNDFINGLNGQASITIASDTNTLTIPLEALKDSGTVLVQTANGIQSKKITTGISSDSEIEIKEGLREGERVVLNPTNISLRQTPGLFTEFHRLLGGGNRNK